ncbi:hypothetical protein TNCV_1583491 [Trichonephila clavipes]|nr:hypothetical protein TNCV_1583491 [Trichonephila clavipes]
MLSIKRHEKGKPKSFTDARETLLWASTLYDALSHSNGLSPRSTSRLTRILSDLQRNIKAHTYKHPNVVLTQPFTLMIRP